MKCKRCNKILGLRNKSGYCTNCYSHSPQYLGYQRNKQREWYAKEENKNKKCLYRQKPKVKEAYQKYQKKYQKDNMDRLRIIKRNWERLHRNRHDKK